MKDRDRESVSGGGQRKRGRHRIWSRFQDLSCQHRARRRVQTHGPGDRDLSWSQTLNQLSHPRTPHWTLINIKIHFQNHLFHNYGKLKVLRKSKKSKVLRKIPKGIWLNSMLTFFFVLLIKQQWYNEKKIEFRIRNCGFYLVPTFTRYGIMNTKKDNV